MVVVEFWCIPAADVIGNSWDDEGRGQSLLSQEWANPTNPPTSQRNFLKPASCHLIAPSHGTHAFIMLCAVFVLGIPYRIYVGYSTLNTFFSNVTRIHFSMQLYSTWYLRKGRDAHGYSWTKVKSNWIIYMTLQNCKSINWLTMSVSWELIQFAWQHGCSSCLKMFCFKNQGFQQF